MTKKRLSNFQSISPNVSTNKVGWIKALTLSESSWPQVVKDNSRVKVVVKEEVEVEVEAEVVVKEEVEGEAKSKAKLKSKAKVGRDQVVREYKYYSVVY